MVSAATLPCFLKLWALPGRFPVGDCFDHSDSSNVTVDKTLRENATGHVARSLKSDDALKGWFWNGYRTFNVDFSLSLWMIVCYFVFFSCVTCVSCATCMGQTGFSQKQSRI